MLILSALLVAACGNATATGSPGSSTSAPESPSASTGSNAPATASSEPSAEPASGSPSAGESAGPAESPGSSTSGSSGSGSAGAAACSGSAENRDFFASMAAAVDWPVYCPVLPDGWFVESGQYRLADGGRLEIVYQGPQRAQVTLDEGAFCTIQGGCVPPGQDVGSTAFDGQDGMLVALDDGSWAIALDREASPSWLLVVTGLDEATARSIAANLVVVQG
ncbi:MAG: hypothetical protein ACXWXR_09415 [Candidatus Limnocylindrales bacterium]